MAFEQLVRESDQARDFAALREAGQRFGKVFGENAARALVSLAAAAIGRTGGELISKLASLPRADPLFRAVLEQGGFDLAAVGALETVVVSPGTVSISLATSTTGVGGLGSTGTPRAPHRTKPRIEDGDLKQGWRHIDARHVTGNHPRGPGDLFAPGTTRAQLQKAAEEIVRDGTRITSPNEQRQVFQMKIRINGLWDLVQVVVDSYDANRVITMFPCRGGC